MNLTGSLLELTDAEQFLEFRQELRSFFAAELPPEIASRMLAGFHPQKADMQLWATALMKKGWGAPGWPREFGGTGWSGLQRYIFEEESALAGAPPHGTQALSLIGPVIYTFGSEQLRRRYLPKMLTGEEIWAQGFSEPSAGSDLASLRTSATPTEGGWTISGHKIWTSDFHIADQFYCLARTNSTVKPQRGLSIFILNPRAPGISFHPIVSIDGGHTLNEVFLDDVFVPTDHLVGQEGQGWTYAKFLLNNERAWAAEVPRIKREFSRLVDLLALETQRTLPMDATLGNLEAEIMALEGMTLRVLEDDGTQAETPSATANMLKVLGSELQQKIAELQVRALGNRAAVFYPPFGEGVTESAMAKGAGVVCDALFRRAASIYGGANEVQRDIIGRLLGS